MKRIFWVLALCLAVTGKVFSQEEGDDFFEEEEPPAESDFEYQPPPNAAPSPDPEDPAPRTRFSRPGASGSNFPSNFNPPSSMVGMNPDGSFEFRLVDPPEYKQKKPKFVVPYRLRSKVQENVRAAERLKDGDK